MVIQGGALNYTLRLAKQLLERGASVAILTLREDRSAFRIPAGLEVISLGGPLTSSLGYWLLFPYWQRRLSQAIAAWRPDVLVPQVFPTNWWGWLHKRRYPSVKLIWICHEPSAFIHSLPRIGALRPWWKSILARGLSPLLATLDVSLARHTDLIIANSRFTASEIERIYGVSPKGIAYPGIDFAALSRGRLQKKREIITVARLEKFKRIDFLLEVFKEVLKVHPDLTFNIVGTGVDEKTLQDLAKSLGLESRVVFRGSADGPTLIGLYQRACLFLNGSVDEPFGMAPLEAIACGTPVVAHKSGGLMEFVSEDCGRLIASVNVEDWAREISEYLAFLFAHEDFPVRVRECARKFDWQLSLQPAVEVIAELYNTAKVNPSNPS